MFEGGAVGTSTDEARTQVGSSLFEKRATLKRSTRVHGLEQLLGEVLGPGVVGLDELIAEASVVGPRVGSVLEFLQ